MAVNAAVPHPVHPAQARRTALHVTLWVAQVILFAFFGFAGFLKLFTPIPQLAQTVVWAADVPMALVRFIGLAELSGALGLILPSLARVKPGLTPLAALGLATIMVLAIGFHLMRGELMAVPFVIVPGAIAAFIAWGRSRAARIEPR